MYPAERNHFHQKEHENASNVQGQVCSFLNRLLTPRPVRLFKDLGSRKFWFHAKDVAYIAAGCQAFRIGNHFFARTPHCCPR
jgi:hypothetical protein